MGERRLINLASSFTIADGRRFRLDRVDPADTKGFSADKEEAEGLLQDTVQRITTLQEQLYAQDQWGVLLIFQAMDAAGKDSAIKHVFSGVNPQGIQVFSFKAPSAEELDHDFLWRTTVRLPERGRIGIFNRSYYEEVLVVRVHPELLRSERLPGRVQRNIWAERYDDIRSFERHLARSGYIIRKFFLHVSREEQAQRFLKRLDEPNKRWKFSMADVRERERWTDYMNAYEEAVRHTSSPYAPWVVVPADRKWFARLVIAGTVLGALEQLRPKAPEVPPGHERELKEVRAALMKEIGGSGGRRQKGSGRKQR
jgi:PPK2 family polyphosphate:nucleotide phosphotransferase